ncbi:hypothetical protein [Candidatus Methanoperedens nitratireducens]|nr:hypothetical protein [Candidatus Methanoperedens nitroreducens]
MVQKLIAGARKNPFNDDILVIGREKAERYTASLKDELRGATGEEDIRLATYNFLKELTKEMGVNIKIQNEKIVLTGGRIDSLFDNIILEFKRLAYFDSKAGIEEAIEGRKGKGGAYRVPFINRLGRIQKL